MTIDEYKQAVIALFQSREATEEQWNQMASAVLSASNGENPEDVKAIDDIVAGKEVECLTCGSLYHPNFGCWGCSEDDWG
jgi:hypothetical protein